MTCPTCGRAFPFGDPRELVPGRQCFACDLEAAEPHVIGMDAPTVENDPIGRFRGMEMAEDRCAKCGTLIGIGIRAMHLGLCDACSGKES